MKTKNFAHFSPAVTTAIEALGLDAESVVYNFRRARVILGRNIRAIDVAEVMIRAMESGGDFDHMLFGLTTDQHHVEFESIDDVLAGIELTLEPAPHSIAA